MIKFHAYVISGFEENGELKIDITPYAASVYRMCADARNELDIIKAEESIGEKDTSKSFSVISVARNEKMALTNFMLKKCKEEDAEINVWIRKRVDFLNGI